VAAAVNVVIRNTSVSIGAQVAFAIVAAAGLSGGFPAEAGYTRAFLMGALGAAATLVVSAVMPARLPARA
jgi:hypothetical protein